MTADFPWSLLGIAPTTDTRAIRSAYAARIKAMDLDADVAGYADLREARDTALHLAKALPTDAARQDAPAAATAAELPPATDTPPRPAPEGGWPDAALALTGEWTADPALVIAPPRADDAPLLAALAPGFRAEETRSSAPPATGATADPFSPPLLPGREDAPAIGTETLQSPFTRLGRLLDPDTSSRFDEPLALALLDMVLGAIHWAPVDHQGEMEEWLADRLARGWPRSAALLEPATAALGWEREWGRIDARPTIEILGARLRGLRFQRKVQDRGHRYHAAWTELSRPGKAGPLRFLRASGGDVRGLLTGLRKNFPDIERQLDPRRVASWEKVRVWPTALLVIGGLLVLGFLISLADPRPEAQRDALKATVAEAFGTQHDPAWLERHQPDLEDLLAKRVRYTQDGAVDQPATVAAGLELVRERVYLDGRLLPDGELDTTMRLRLSLLEAARADGPEACRTMMRAHAPPASTTVPPQVRRQERAFAAALAERGALKAPARAEGRTATVPPELVRQVLHDSGLGKDQVLTAMRKDDDPNRCAVTIALLRATLDWKGADRRDILMTL